MRAASGVAAPGGLALLLLWSAEAARAAWIAPQPPRAPPLPHAAPTRLAYAPRMLRNSKAAKLPQVADDIDGAGGEHGAIRMGVESPADLGRRIALTTALCLPAFGMYAWVRLDGIVDCRYMDPRAPPEACVA